MQKHTRALRFLVVPLLAFGLLYAALWAIMYSVSDAVRVHNTCRMEVDVERSQPLDLILLADDWRWSEGGIAQYSLAPLFSYCEPVHVEVLNVTLYPATRDFSLDLDECEYRLNVRLECESGVVVSSDIQLQNEYMSEVVLSKSGKDLATVPLSIAVPEGEHLVSGALILERAWLDSGKIELVADMTFKIRRTCSWNLSTP